MGLLGWLFGKQSDKNPEDEFLITITDELVHIEHPKRKPEQIHWKNIEEIKLINTDSGPWLPDIWLALLGEEEGCLIPQGAKGADEVNEIIFKYEGFNFDNFIKSMSYTGNGEFLLWRKK